MMFAKEQLIREIETLPDAKVLIAEVERTRRMLEMKAATGNPKAAPK